jgi:outer membrane cobalamin receptor
VQAGDRIPGIPRQNFKLRAAWQSTPRLFVGVTLVCESSRFAIGNENNQAAGGSVPGYAVVNLDAHFQIDQHLQLFGRINNVFDRNYQTGGILGQNFFTGPGFTYNLAGAQPSLFSSPGAPFGIWAGLRYEFGKPSGPAKRV